MRIDARDVTVRYGSLVAVEDASVTITEGELLALVGPNGSGKSTLLRALSGILHPSRGSVSFDGTPINALSSRRIAQRVAVLEQDDTVGFDFTVRELTEWGRIPHRNRFSSWKQRDEAAVRFALQATEMEELAHRSIHSISGGERQRAFLAMALAQQPLALLLDEPTAHLDLKHQFELFGLIRSLAARGLAVCVALHDLNLAARYADRVAVLSEGRLRSVDSPERVFTRKLIEEVWGVSVEVHSATDGPYVVPRKGPAQGETASRA